MTDDELAHRRDELARRLADANKAADEGTTDPASVDGMNRDLLAALAAFIRLAAADDLTGDERAALDAAIAGDTSITTARAVTAIVGRRKAQRLPPVSAQTRALARRPGDHLAIDNNVARSPLFSIRRETLSGPRRLKSTHKIVLATFIRQFADDGCPYDGWVTLPLARLNRLFYGNVRGGHTYDRVKQRLEELYSAGVAGEWVNTRGERTSTWYSVVQGAVITEEGKGEAKLQFSQAVQASIRAGQWTYIDPSDVAAIRKASPRSDLPMDLYLWLAAERMPLGDNHGRRVFPAAEGKGPRERERPRSVSELLGLTAERRRNTVARIRQAAAVVCKVLPEYHIEVRPAKQATMWNLFADRVKVIEAAPTPAKTVHEGTTAPAYERTTAGVENSPLAYERTLPDVHERVLPEPVENSDASPASVHERVTAAGKSVHERVTAVVHERVTAGPVENSAKCLHTGSDTTQDVGDATSFLLRPKNLNVRKKDLKSVVVSEDRANDRAHADILNHSDEKPDKPRRLRRRFPEGYNTDFIAFVDAYGDRRRLGAAEELYLWHRLRGAGTAELLASAQNYSTDCDLNGRIRQMLTTFLAKASRERAEWTEWIDFTPKCDLPEPVSRHSGLSTAQMLKIADEMDNASAAGGALCSRCQRPLTAEECADETLTKLTFFGYRHLDCDDHRGESGESGES